MTDKYSLGHLVVDSLEGLLALKEDWATLLAKVPEASIPHSHGWVQSWWASFGKLRQLRIHCFHGADGMIGVFPMLLERSRYRGLPVSVEASLTNGHSPFWEPLIHPGVPDVGIAEMITMIRESSRADVISFLRLPKLGKFAHALARLRMRGCLVGSRSSTTTPLIRINSGWETYFNGRSQKFRKGLRNKVNRFTSSGLKMEHVQLRTVNDTALHDMALVSGQSWKARIGTDLASQPTAWAFVRELVAQFGAEGGTSVWIAREGAKAIAYEFHVRFRSTTYPLRADFDEGHRESAPGSVVEYSALKDLFMGSETTLYDSCANDYWYLRNWTDDFREHADIEMFRRRPFPAAVYTIEYRLAPFLRRLKSALRPKRPDSQPTSSH